MAGALGVPMHEVAWQGGLCDKWGSLPRSHNLHRSLQSVWQPTLSSASLAGYAPAMNAAAERLTARLSAVAAQGGEADMLARFFRVAVDIVGTAVFGCALGCLEHHGHKLSFLICLAGPVLISWV